MNIAAALFGRNFKPQETKLLLPVRNIVLLPGITLPIVAGRSRSIAVAESTMMTEQKELIVAAIRPETAKRLEKDENAEIESLEQIYPIATLAVVPKI